MKSKKHRIILNPRKLTKVNNVPIPATPGTAQHSIIASLASTKEIFCTWNKIVQLVERYMIQFGGDQSWEKFTDNKTPEEVEENIKQHVSSLARKGKNYPGFFLHKLGLVVYCFEDGAILHAGGKYISKGRSYEVSLKKGKGLQIRSRGRSMTYNEYNQYIERGAMDVSGKVIDEKKMKSTKSEEPFDMDDELVRDLLGM